MARTLPALLCIVAVGLASSSCRKIDTIGPEATLSAQPATARDGIPISYGDLVGVIPGETGQAALVFQKGDKTLAVVWIDAIRGVLSETVTTIPRR